MFSKAKNYIQTLDVNFEEEPSRADGTNKQMVSKSKMEEELTRPQT